jgi:hypothetical protein
MRYEKVVYVSYPDHDNLIILMFLNSCIRVLIRELSEISRKDYIC